jgi:hypothetical protein
MESDLPEELLCDVLQLLVEDLRFSGKKGLTAAAASLLCYAILRKEPFLLEDVWNNLAIDPQTLAKNATLEKATDQGRASRQAFAKKVVESLNGLYLETRMTDKLYCAFNFASLTGRAGSIVKMFWEGPGRRGVFRCNTCKALYIGHEQRLMCMRDAVQGVSMHLIADASLLAEAAARICLRAQKMLKPVM